jgi:hypothetical protein
MTEMKKSSKNFSGCAKNAGQAMMFTADSPHCFHRRAAEFAEISRVAIRPL